MNEPPLQNYQGFNPTRKANLLKYENMNTVELTRKQQMKLKYQQELLKQIEDNKRKKEEDRKRKLEQDKLDEIRLEKERQEVLRRQEEEKNREMGKKNEMDKRRQAVIEYQNELKKQIEDNKQRKEMEKNAQAQIEIRENERINRQMGQNNGQNTNFGQGVPPIGTPNINQNGNINTNFIEPNNNVLGNYSSGGDGGLNIDISKQYVQSQKIESSRLGMSEIKNQIQEELKKQLEHIKNPNGTLHRQLDQKVNQGFGEIKK